MQSTMQASKRLAASNPGPLLAGRLEAVHCQPFDAGYPSSPSLVPSQKRLRPPPQLPALGDLPPLPALTNAPAYELPPQELEASGPGPPACAGAAVSNDLRSLVGIGSGGNSSDWRMVLYHDRHVILHNPGEKPPFRSRRLSLEESCGTELSNTFGRCPLCRQTVDARFAFVAQAYFDLLQRLHRTSSSSGGGSSSADAGNCADIPDESEVDLIAESDLYRILGVPRGARSDDIKRAYRSRALRYHPDKNLHDPDAKHKFQKIAEAFSVLSDEKKRLKYDKSGDMDLDDFDMEQFMNMVHASVLKFKSQKTGETEWEDADMEVCEMVEEPAQPLGDQNPFLLAEQVPVGAAVASEGGAEAKASAAASLRHLPAGLLNTGYYTRFFVETRELGSGSFGSVYLCRHVLDDLTLGDYAVKKVPVGDNKAWLR